MKGPKIDLKTALALTGVFENDGSLVYIKENDGMNRTLMMSVKEVRESYDLEKTKVTGIRLFNCRTKIYTDTDQLAPVFILAEKEENNGS